MEPESKLSTTDTGRSGMISLVIVGSVALHLRLSVNCQLTRYFAPVLNLLGTEVNAALEIVAGGYR